MATLRVRIRNAERQPLPDRVDVEVRSARTHVLAKIVRDARGRQAFRFDDLVDGQVYTVRAFPLKHRPVGQFVMVRDTTSIEMFCPIHPDRVTDVTFPEYAALDADLRRVLETSDVEDAQGRGQALYDGLDDPVRRAGLLNLFAKMNATPLSRAVSAWHCVDTLYRIRGDRVFANVKLEFRDLVKSAEAAGQFKDAPDLLHTPPTDFNRAGSFKSLEAYGNLQLSFFASDEAPPRFKVDADIDDAGGLEHGFQVLRNWLTGKPTHPYDIHQILTFHHRLDPGYRLAT